MKDEQSARVIVEAAINPTWKVRRILIGGEPVPMLTVDHPRLGELHFVLDTESAVRLSVSLHEIVNR